LAGRTIEETLFPFSFREFLSYFAPSLNIEARPDEARGFPESFSSSMIPVAKDVSIWFDKFLRLGGFPHIYAEDEALIPKFIKDDILDKVVFRDLVELYGIREPSYLEKLFYYLGRNTACIVSLSDISRSIGISRPVVERYISHLERSLLYFRLPKFSRSAKQTLRSSPKGHVIDPALANFFGAHDDQILESAVASFLYPRFQKRLYFWRDQIHEIDVIADDETLTPIEIKNSERQKVPRGLLYFMEKHDLPRGYVVYRGSFARVVIGSRQIIFCPAWYFLLQARGREN
jgi:predicted AAA+ superfamily ATPase